MATKLKNLKVTSVDVVPAGANPDAHICLFKTQKVKTEDGTDYPSAAYAYVPDPDKPSTWKLRLWEDPDKKITAKQVGMAVAALGAGFRGNKAAIPADDLPKVKAKVLAAWKQVNPDAKDNEISEVLKKDSTKKSLAKSIFAAIAKALSIDSDAVSKDSGTAATFDDAYTDRLAQQQCQAACNEVWDMVMALQNSLCSIMMDGSLDSDAKSNTMEQSVNEFDTAVSSAIENWCQSIPSGQVSKSQPTPEQIEMLKTQQNRINEILEKAAGTPAATEEGVTDTMKIDKSKMTADEAAQLEAFEKKYGISDGDPEPSTQKSGSIPATIAASDGNPAPAAPVGKSATSEMNPEVKKALDEVETLRKSLELRDQSDIAKKYEILGKKPEELAKKLVDLKKAGGTAYDDYVALLDEQVNIVQKSGLFDEKGSNAEDGGGDSWDKINKAASEIQKSDSSLSHPQAIAKAVAAHPELLNEYEQSYATK